MRYTATGGIRNLEDPRLPSGTVTTVWDSVLHRIAVFSGGVMIIAMFLLAA